MEQIIPLLQYLESIDGHRGFTLHGTIDPMKTPLDEINAVLKSVNFGLVFLTVEEIKNINPTWIKENSVVFETISWKAKVNGFSSSIIIYFNLIAPCINIISSDGIFLRRVEELSHQTKFRFNYQP